MLVRNVMVLKYLCVKLDRLDFTRCILSVTSVSRSALFMDFSFEMSCASGLCVSTPHRLFIFLHMKTEVISDCLHIKFYRELIHRK